MFPNRLSGQFEFGSNVCAPSFYYSEFEIAERASLITEFPQHAGLIRRL